MSVEIPLTPSALDAKEIKTSCSIADLTHTKQCALSRIKDFLPHQDKLPTFPNRVGKPITIIDQEKAIVRLVEKRLKELVLGNPQNENP